MQKEETHTQRIKILATLLCSEIRVRTFIRILADRMAAAMKSAVVNSKRTLQLEMSDYSVGQSVYQRQTKDQYQRFLLHRRYGGIWNQGRGEEDHCDRYPKQCVSDLEMVLLSPSRDGLQSHYAAPKLSSTRFLAGPCVRYNQHKKRTSMSTKTCSGRRDALKISQIHERVHAHYPLLIHTVVNGAFSEERLCQGVRHREICSRKMQTKP
jgi:hypothetical protein